MIAVDTNILLRFVMDDDDRQSASSHRVIQGGDVVLLTTVIIETYWALTARYGLTSAEALEAVQSVVALDGVQLQEPDVIVGAFDLARQGLEFADAVHVSSARTCTAFVTFDKALVKRAAGLDSPQVRGP